MDYTLSPDHTTDAGTGNRMHEDNAAVTTAWSAKDANSVIWSLMAIAKAAGLVGVQFDKTVPASYSTVIQAIKRIAGGNVTTVNAGNSPFALTADHAGLVILDATAGNVSATLPLADVLAALQFDFVRLDATANTATINRSGANTIDQAAASVLLTGRATTSLASNGVAGWLSMASTADVVRYRAAAATLPTTNIGPIWHDTYNSIMTWQSFTANGAAYTGYASVNVGGLLLDTQPTARLGYVKSGVSNLSRTAYAALRAWALHNGVLVASGAWAAGAFVFKDNVDGTTFTDAKDRRLFIESRA